ncbi:YCF48-related protein [Pseudomonas sp. GV071]|uniref:YCF48-related protein n=1 Tax=Pseudomonas sp. GV071 TaxID=2135754 RepID=UPI000D3DB1F0|nr:YCF48-related protein [Pseudomonas sp. GV071]PTQ73183.1 photosystem II stability/assembly factor-like uncharacterized protein [Pseudomonas sp. GV071]
MNIFNQAVRSLLALLLCSVCLAARAEFIDVLDLPARISPLARVAPLDGVRRCGERLVAVGQRGHILLADSAAGPWQQAQVAVSSDLTAVYCASAQQGWAVGHDGVIVHSDDAGQHWSKQLDGRQIGALMQAHYAALASAEPGNDEWASRLAEAQRMVDEGADKALLDVWFANEKLGYAVGVFGLILRTEDGGGHWQPFGEHTDNPQRLHLNAIAAVDGVPYIAGEQGLLLRWSAEQQRFVALQTPYSGSFFGVTGAAHELLAYGLRGHVLRSSDDGLTWQQLETGVQSNITAAARDTTGRFVFFTQAGHVLRLNATDQALQAVPQAEMAPISAAQFSADDSLVLVGNRGVRSQRLP